MVQLFDQFDEEAEAKAIKPKWEVIKVSPASLLPASQACHCFPSSPFPTSADFLAISSVFAAFSSLVSVSQAAARQGLQPRV
eukprot:503242-Rhodomonas_salina.1